MKKKKIRLDYFLFKVPLLLLLIVLFINPSVTFAKNKFGKRLPISININTGVDYETDCHRVVSNFKANIKGAADLTEENGEFLRYTSNSLTVSYEFKEDNIEMCHEECLGKIVEQWSGSGNAKLESFILDIFLGQSGKFAWIASQGRLPAQEELKIPKDMYGAMLVAEGKSIVKGKSEIGCDLVYERSLPLTISLAIGRAEIKPWGATGNYRWQGNEGIYEDENVLISRVIDPVPLDREEKHYQVSWTFGEVKPVVRIYREEKDITDTEKEEIIVGKKVKLRAKIFPEGYGTPQGKWEIGGKIVSGWHADNNNATLIPFKDYDKSEIEFFWVNGEFTGKQEIVKYSGKVNGSDVNAKTKFFVYKPRIKSEKVEAGKMVTIGMLPEKGKEGGKLICRLYAGYVEPPDPKPPGIHIFHEIEMPPMDREVQHLLQHVQLVIDDTLHHHNVNYFRKRNDQWCLDTEYPYNGRLPFRIKMLDTPGPEIGKLTKEIHIQNEFQTYLMFVPSANSEDADAIWVPLRLIKWEWAAGVKKGDNLPRDAPCDKTTYKPIYEVPARVKGKENTSDHPIWSCNIDNKEDNKEDIKEENIGSQGYDDEKWKRLTDERTKKWRGK